MAATYSSFEGTVALKGTFKKLQHSSGGGGLELKVMTFEVDDDCMGWERVKMATRSLPPISKASLDSERQFMYGQLMNNRKDLLTGKSRTISVLGKSLSFAQQGQRGNLIGTLLVNPKFQQVQMSVNEVAIIPPETNQQMVALLVGLLDGVGEVMAKGIVDRLGLKEVLNVLGSDNAVAALVKLKLPRLGEGTAQKIKKQWDISGGKTILHQRLQSYGLPPYLIIELVKHLSSLPLPPDHEKDNEAPPSNNADDLIEILRLDPYNVLLQVYGASFNDAEILASKLGGIPSDLISRASFAMIQCLAESTADGNTHTQWSKLKASSLTMLRGGIMGKWNEEKESVASAAINLNTLGLIHLEQMDESSGKRTPITSKSSLMPDTRVYFKSLHQAESNLSRFIADRVMKSWDLADVPESTPMKSPTGAGGGKRKSEAFGEPDDEAGPDDGLTADQIRAVKLAQVAPIMLLTGGAGVGKTYTCRLIVEQWLKSGKKVAVCAPTGRASQRIQEALGNDSEGAGKVEATTIHRLLGFRGGDQEQMSVLSPEGARLKEYLDSSLASYKLQFCASNMLPYDCLLIDEASMLDLQLAYALFQALPDTTQVLFVGDHNQLPPVGCGHVLSALLSLQRPGLIPAAGCIPRVHLDKIFRQNGAGSIVKGALQVIQGDHPSAMKASNLDQIIEILSQDNDLVPSQLSERLGGDAILVQVPEESQTRDIEAMAVDLATSLKASGIDVRADLQLLSPLVKVSSSLNQGAQHVMNPRKGGKLGLRDRVLQVKNDYKLEVWNGDLGTVEYINEKDRIMKVAFPRRGVPHLVEYQGTEENQLSLAWSTTVHKSQGGEYPCVILVLDHIDLFSLGSRQLLYTAVTRAKHCLFLIATKSALRMCLNGDVSSAAGGEGQCIAKRIAFALKSSGKECELKPSVVDRGLQQGGSVSPTVLYEDQEAIAPADIKDKKWAVSPKSSRARAFRR